MAKQYLTFSLDNNLYAIEVSQVQEVLGYTQPAKLPCTAPYIEGLIDSRDQGITVISLRKKFNLNEIAVTKTTRIIVLELKAPTDENPDHVTVFGAIADAVNEVIELDDTKLEPPPKFGNAISTDFISGMGKKDDKFIIILDAMKIFENKDISINPSDSDSEKEDNH